MSKKHYLPLILLAALSLTACTEEAKKEEAVKVMEKEYPEVKVDSVEIVEEEVDGVETEVAIVESTVEGGAKSTTVIDTETKEVKRSNNEIRKLSEKFQPIVDEALDVYIDKYVVATFIESGEGLDDSTGFSSEIFLIYASNEEHIDLMYDSAEAIQANDVYMPFTLEWESFRLSSDDMDEYISIYGDEVNLDALQDFDILSSHKEFLDLTDTGI